MKAQIAKQIIKSTIKKGFYIEIDSDTKPRFKKIINIEDDVVTLEDNREIDYQYAENHVVKFIAVYSKEDKPLGNSVTSIHYTDYTNIIENLESCKIEDQNGDSILLIDAFNDGEEIEFPCILEKIHLKANVGDPILLTSLRHIDRLKAYEKSNRVGTIKAMIADKYIIKFNNYTETIKVSRDEFELVGRKNINYITHIICQYCLR